MIRKAQLYRGIVILPADENSSGIRWTARLSDGTRLRTDTLMAMKDWIRKLERGTK